MCIHVIGNCVHYIEQIGACYFHNISLIGVCSEHRSNLNVLK